VTDKRSSASELIFKALEDEKNPLSLLPDAEVRRVLFDREMRATGVEVRMRKALDARGVMADPNHLAIGEGANGYDSREASDSFGGALGSPAIRCGRKCPTTTLGAARWTHASMPTLDCSSARSTR